LQIVFSPFAGQYVDSALISVAMMRPSGIIISCVLIVTMISFASAEERDDYVAAHNSVRQALNAGIPDLQWSDDLAAYAAYYVQNSALRDFPFSHSGLGYGENLFWTTGDSSPGAVVGSWASEQQYYHIDSNSCDGGQVCGHYTKIVWRNTLQVGCASATCKASVFAGGTAVMCYYWTPGNWAGESAY
jgi:pathogenesis-related protein 1